MSFTLIIITIAFSVNFSYLWCNKANIIRLILFNLCLLFILFLVSKHNILFIFILVQLMWFLIFTFKNNVDENNE